MLRLLSLSLVSVALAAPPPPSQCAAIVSRAPCGQPSDSAALCAVKGCCHDASGGGTSCFYAGGNAVPITTVHVVQACHFDAGEQRGAERGSARVCAWRAAHEHSVAYGCCSRDVVWDGRVAVRPELALTLT